MNKIQFIINELFTIDEVKQKVVDLTALPLFTVYTIGYSGAEPDASFLFNAVDLNDAISKVKDYASYHSTNYPNNIIVKTATIDDIKNKQNWIHNEYIYSHKLKYYN